MNLLSNTIPAATPSFVTEVTTANFVAAVVQASMQAPVVAFFWSPRSPGCKAYGEALAKQINALGGAVTLARINIDSNMQIAAQLRIESVPTTYIFQQGQPVDGFAGAIDDKGDCAAASAVQRRCPKCRTANGCHARRGGSAGAKRPYGGSA